VKGWCVRRRGKVISEKGKVVGIGTLEVGRCPGQGEVGGDLREVGFSHY
jgi:hypothetical protein